MGSSGDESIDWIREFKAPDRSFELSSDTSPEVTPKPSHDGHNEVERLRKKRDTVLISSGEDTPVSKSGKPKTSKRKTRIPKPEALDAPVDGQEDTKVKPATTLVSRLPLVFPEKVHRSKALVECDGESIDLSGDVGAVGRIIVSKGSSGNNELFLDLKVMIKQRVVCSRKACGILPFIFPASSLDPMTGLFTMFFLFPSQSQVSVGQSEAKIEAIMNDFVRLEPQSNMFEAETMIEGTLDGFSFYSDEEGEKVSKVSVQQSDPNNENEGQANKRARGKTEKSLGTPNKKKKPSAKAPKKVPRKSQVAKRTKKSKR